MLMRWNQKTILIAVALVLLLAVVALSSSGNLNFAGSSGIFPIKAGGKYGFIDRSGKLAIQPQFDDAAQFQDGLAPVSVGKTWGYIDRRGKLTINPQFEMADPFSEGLALVGIGHRFGYIHKDGKFAINPSSRERAGLKTAARRCWSADAGAI
jgi:KWG Leptospira.